MQSIATLFFTVWVLKSNKKSQRGTSSGTTHKIKNEEREEKPTAMPMGLR